MEFNNDVIDVEVVEATHLPIDFKITDLTSGKAQFNYEELKTQINQQLEYYRGVAVTEETLPKAKCDLAFLNKKIDDFESERKYIEKEIMKNYNNNFKPQYKELLETIKEVATSIKNQVNGYEEIRKQAKKQEIEAYYKSLTFTYFIPLEKIFNDKWLNKFYSMDNVKADITAKMQEVKDNLEVIENTIHDEKEVAKAKIEYLRSLDLAQAIKTWQERGQIEKKLSEIPTSQPIPTVIPSEPSNVQVLQIKLVITDTRDKILAVGKFLKDNNINFKQIKEEE
jgi:hypothetical protein